MILGLRKRRIVICAVFIIRKSTSIVLLGICFLWIERREIVIHVKNICDARQLCNQFLWKKIFLVHIMQK